VLEKYCLTKNFNMSFFLFHNVNHVAMSMWQSTNNIIVGGGGGGGHINEKTQQIIIVMKYFVTIAIKWKRFP
jgi:hypothetical protein